MRKLNALKNMIWALSIVLCVAAVLIALLFAAFTRYSGPKERGGVQLGAGDTVSLSKSDVDGGMDGAQSGDGKVHALAGTDDAGQLYVQTLTFLVDSTMIGLRDYGLLSGGIETTQVWGSQEGNIPVATLADCVIRYPADGSQISPADAAMVAKPARLIICLGADGLTQVTEEDFKAGYTSLVQSIQSSSPDTIIVLCSLPSVTADYHGTDELTPELIDEANAWVRSVCAQTGARYADVAAALNSSDGYLMNGYAAANGKSLNSAGLNVMLQYLRSHAV